MDDKPVVRSIYHFTHLENIASIFKDGVLWPDNKVTGSNIYAHSWLPFFSFSLTTITLEIDGPSLTNKRSN